MNQEHKPVRRIVSKGVYAFGQTRRAVVYLCGFSWLFAMILCGLLTLLLLAGGIWSPSATLLAMGAFFGVLTYHTGKAGMETVNEARHLDPGVPLTRANTDDLPASDSLVRASQEPVGAQEAVLLRAATGDPQEKQEELLRAAAREDE